MACKGGAPTRTVFALGLAVNIAAFVAGCSAARVTQPLPVGPDTYTLSSRTSSGGTDPAREAAVTAAGQQCARLSKKLLILSSDTNFGSNENQGVVNLKFRCLAADDPELHRPSAPDVVIKNTHP
jgi:hypothetical protein